MRLIFILTTLTITTPLPCFAGTLSLFELERVSIEGYQYEDIRDPYIAPDDTDLDMGATFGTDFNLLRVQDYRLYMENELHFDKSRVDGQVKHAGWHYEIGLALTEKVQIFHEHHSRHVFDEERPGPFPVYDRSGLRINLFLRSK